MTDSPSSDRFADPNRLPTDSADTATPTSTAFVQDGDASSAMDADALLKGGLDAVALAGQRNTPLDQASSSASQAAPWAKSALEALNRPNARAHEDVPGLDSHPRAGQALLDFAAASPIQLFSPSRPTPSADTLADQAAALLGLTDNARLLRLLTPLAAQQTLLIDTIEGHSALSQVEEYTLRLLSENRAISHKEIMMDRRHSK